MPFRVPDRTPRGNDAAQINIPKLLLSHVAGAILDGLDGISFGIFNLDDLADELRGTKVAAATANTAAQVATTTANQAAIAAGQAQQQVAVKVNLTDIRTNVPLWQSIRSAGFSVYPRSQLIYRRTATPVTVTGPQSGSGTTHVHSIPGLTMGLSAPTYGINDNSQMLGFVRAEKDSVIGRVTWVGRIGAGNAATDMRVKVWKMNDTTGATVTVVEESANLVGAGMPYGTSDDPSVTREISYVFPESILVESGDILMFGIRSVGTHVIAGSELWKPDPLPGTFPRALGGNLSLAAGVSFPAAVDYSDISWTSTFTMFASFEPVFDVSVEKRIIDDNFDRPNGGLGDRWRISSTNLLEGLRIKDNAAEWDGNNALNDGSTIGTYFSPVSTDKTDGRVVVKSTNGNRLGYIHFRMTADAKVGAVIAFNSTNIYIGYRTGVSSYLWVQSIGQSIGEQTVIEWAVNETAYVVYVNGVPKLSFSMPLTQVPTGPGHRYFAIQTGRNNFGDAPSFDRVYYQDTPDVEVVAA